MDLGVYSKDCTHSQESWRKSCLSIEKALDHSSKLDGYSPARRADKSHSQKHSQAQEGEWAQEREFEALALFGKLGPGKTTRLALVPVRGQPQNPRLCHADSSSHTLGSESSSVFLLNCLPAPAASSFPRSHVGVWPWCSGSPVTCHLSLDAHSPHALSALQGR